MWRKQIRAEEAAREAQALSDRAAQLREESLQRPGSREGMTSEETSENESESGSHAVASHNPSPGITGRSLGRAAEGLRGAAEILHGRGDESYKRRSGESSNSVTAG
jgi:hypothetical protein